MKKELTPEFVSKVLKLNSDFKVHYCKKYTNIEITDVQSENVRFMNIHEFIHTHCKDFLISYANGLKIVSETKHDEEHYKIVTLNLDCAPCFFYSPRPLICSRDDVQFKCIKELTTDMVYHTAKNYLNNKSLG